MCPTERSAYWFLAAALAAVLGLIIFAPISEASVQLVPRWALEKNASQEGTGNADRLYGVELLCPLNSAMRIKTEIGGWTSKQEGRKSMFYGSVAWGYQAQLPLGGFSLQAFVGPAWVSDIDAYQSSRWQIKHDLGAGWADAKGWGVGFGYSHLSNGGAVGPNLGRDFLGMRFLIPL